MLSDVRSIRELGHRGNQALFRRASRALEINALVQHSADAAGKLPMEIHNAKQRMPAMMQS